MIYKVRLEQEGRKTDTIWTLAENHAAAVEVAVGAYNGLHWGWEPFSGQATITPCPEGFPSDEQMEKEG